MKNYGLRLHYISLTSFVIPTEHFRMETPQFIQNWSVIGFKISCPHLVQNLGIFL